MSSLPQTGFLRLPQIIGQDAVSESQAAANRRQGKGPRRSRSAITPIIPIKKSAWWEGVNSGRFPKPVRTLGQRVTAWRVEDIRALIERSGRPGGA